MFQNIKKLLQNIKNILQIVTIFKLFCNNYVTIKRKNKLKSKNFKLIN